MPSSYDKRLSRNWHELLQELRVTQTGTQILTGFLLTLPFTSRFVELDERQKLTFLVTIVGSVITTGLIVAPVAFHRVLFHKRQRPWLVAAADITAKIGLFMLALTTSAVILLVFDVVLSWRAALMAAPTTFVGLIALWGVTPWLARRNGRLDAYSTEPGAGPSIRKASPRHQ
ncbi:MAG: DUF6328 family protein [Aeromicrobium sp.]